MMPPDVRSWGLPFRIGATSYIIADDLLPNAAFLAPCVQDMQLVLFEVAGGPSNLPAPADVAALAALGRSRDLTYTVHLLHDLRLRDGGEAGGSATGKGTSSAGAAGGNRSRGEQSGADGAPLSLALAKAQQVIELTRPLRPHAWVCHLDGRTVTAGWQDETAAALRQVCAWAGEGRRVAVENLEGFPPEFVTPVVERTDAARCVDVGHLWLDGVDPLPHLAAALPQLAVVHLHGLAGGRDHASLAPTPPAQLDAVLRLLITAHFAGVLTLEIFGEEDFWSSLAAVEAAVDRVADSR